MTVALFDHPKNIRHPCTWFTMDNKFAYLAATLNLKKEPLALSDGETVCLRYGMAIWDGKASPREIESVYRSWLALAGTDHATIASISG